MFKGQLEHLLNLLFFEDSRMETVEQLLECYERKNELELVAELVKNFYHNESSNWLGDRDWNEVKLDQELLYDLASNRQLPNEAEHKRLMEHIRFPNEYKQRSLLILQQFYRYAYTPIREHVRQLSLDGVAKYQQLFKDQPADSFHKLAKIDPHLIDRNTNVHISFFSQARMDYHRDDREGFSDWMILGIQNDTLSQHREDKEVIEKFLKVIADKRRLQIIDLLMKRTWYGNELAQEMGLTPAAITYHLNFLFELDLVRLNRSEHRIYYELDRTKLTYFFDQTKKVILQH